MFHRETFPLLSQLGDIIHAEINIEAYGKIRFSIILKIFVRILRKTRGRQLYYVIPIKITKRHQKCIVEKSRNHIFKYSREITH